jgi:hypothetical protein
MGNHEIHPEDDSEGTDKEHKKSLRRSWKSSGPVAKLTVVFAGIAACATLLYVIIAACTLAVIQSGSADTRILAQAASDQSKVFWYGQHAWVWVKMLDKFNIQVGKPISAAIEVFNYGKEPTLVRARIFVEAAPMISDAIQERIPEIIGVREILLSPVEGTKEFAAELPRKVLTQEDYRKIMDGTLDVLAYGRIEYANIHDPVKGMANSSFCFYRMKDGTVSACPNPDEHHFTNWAY